MTWFSGSQHQHRATQIGMVVALVAGFVIAAHWPLLFIPLALAYTVLDVVRLVKVLLRLPGLLRAFRVTPNAATELHLRTAQRDAYEWAFFLLSWIVTLFTHRPQ